MQNAIKWRRLMDSTSLDGHNPLTISAVNLFRVLAHTIRTPLSVVINDLYYFSSLLPANETERTQKRAFDVDESLKMIECLIFGSSEQFVELSKKVFLCERGWERLTPANSLNTMIWRVIHSKSVQNRDVIDSLDWEKLIPMGLLDDNLPTALWRFYALSSGSLSISVTSNSISIEYKS